MSSSKSPAKLEHKIYTAERIERVRIAKGGSDLEYFVKWEGYHSSENTWEPRANILDKYLIETFKEEQALKLEHRMAKFAETEGEDTGDATTWSRETKLERRKKLIALQAAAKYLREKGSAKGKRNLGIAKKKKMRRHKRPVSGVVTTEHTNGPPPEISDTEDESMVHVHPIAKVNEENRPEKKKGKVVRISKNLKQKRRGSAAVTAKPVNGLHPNVSAREEANIHPHAIAKGKEANGRAKKKAKVVEVLKKPKEKKLRTDELGNHRKPDASDIVEEARVQTVSTLKQALAILLKTNKVIIPPQRQGVVNGRGVDAVLGIVGENFLVRRNDYALELIRRTQVKSSNPVEVMKYYEGLLRIHKPEYFPEGKGS